MEIYVAALITILVIILLYFCYTYNRWENSMLQGMWEATESFCTESGIDSMMVMIGDNSGNKYKTCLVISAENTVVLDETFDITFGASLPITKKNMNMKLDLDTILLPNKLKCELNLEKGTMVWYENTPDRKEYAVFRKIYI